jgi:hypothetical protein
MQAAATPRLVGARHSAAQLAGRVFLHWASAASQKHAPSKLGG